jgi:hypothetical protein
MSTKSDELESEESARLCKELELYPGEYLDKYVGVVRGRVVIADDDFKHVAKVLRNEEPDARHHFIVLAGQPQPDEIFNFGLA